jgi:hypothetical protein
VDRPTNWFQRPAGTTSSGYGPEKSHSTRPLALGLGLK